MKLAYLLLAVTCHGHTNAECFLASTEYSTREECEAARKIPETEAWFGRVVPEHVDPRKVCIATPKDEMGVSQ